MRKLFFLIVLLFYAFSFRVVAQGEGNFWYFGYNAGLDFNSGAPIAITNGALYTTEGCAAISNSSGNLLFYTDGISVWNKLHNTMPNGTGLMGDPSSTQSGIIVPKPGNPNIYYIFTTPSTGAAVGLRYSEVDLTLNGGLGDVTSVKNVALFSPVTEKLTAVKHANNMDYWVIALDHNSNQYLVYAVTAAGVNTVATISASGTFDSSGYGIGYLKASADGSKLVSVHDFMGVVDVLSFNTGTGVVTFDFTITPPFNNPHGGEFSPDGTRLYIASESNSSIYQYNMALGSSAAIIASQTLIATSTCPNLGALQNAPDGKMYVAKYSFSNIACIPNPNALGTACGYTDIAVDLLGMDCRLGFPNFIQNFLTVPTPSPIDYINTCFGDSTRFWCSDSLLLDSISWNFNDPVSGIYNVSEEYSPAHMFSATGTYTVSAVTYASGVANTQTKVVIITGVPSVFLGNDTVLCEGSSLVLNAGSTPCVWQNLSTNQTFTVTVPDTFYVAVSNSCGTTNDTIICTFKPTPVVSVNNQVICSGDTAHFLANGADAYSWSPGITVTGTNTAEISPASSNTYTVTGTINGCSSTAISAVTVLQLPVPTFSVSAITGCYPLCVQFTKTGSATYLNQGYSFGNGDSTLASSALYCFDTSGVYPVNFFCTDANGCSASTTLLNPITVLAPITAEFSSIPNELPKINTEVSFNNLSTGGVTFNWNFNDPVSGTANVSTLFSPNHVFTSEGIYCVELTISNSAGCTDTASHCIEVIDEIIIPNIITPNGDNRNDLFYIDNLRLGVAKVEVFNRWGKLVYSSEAYMNDWNGSGYADGVYFYLVHYPLDNKTYSGFVHLIDKK